LPISGLWAAQRIVQDNLFINIKGARMSKNQRGFAVVETTLIVVIVAIIAIAAWFVWQSQKNTDKTLNSANNSLPTKVTSTPTPTTTATVTPAPTQYLVISEWGVKVPLTATISDAEYYYGGASVDAAYLSTVSITAQYPLCADHEHSLGAFGRYSDPNEEYIGGMSISQAFPDAVKIGQFYYYYTGTQAGCAPNEAGEASTTATRTAFRQAILGVVAE